MPIFAFAAATVVYLAKIVLAHFVFFLVVGRLCHLRWSSSGLLSFLKQKIAVPQTVQYMKANHPPVDSTCAYSLNSIGSSFFIPTY